MKRATIWFFAGRTCLAPRNAIRPRSVSGALTINDERRQRKTELIFDVPRKNAPADRMRLQRFARIRSAMLGPRFPRSISVRPTELGRRRRRGARFEVGSDCGRGRPRPSAIEAWEIDGAREIRLLTKRGGQPLASAWRSLRLIACSHLSLASALSSGSECLRRSFLPGRGGGATICRPHAGSPGEREDLAGGEGRRTRS